MRRRWWISDYGIWPLSKHLAAPPGSEFGWWKDMKWPCALPLDILVFVLWWFGACNLGLVDKLCGVDKDDQLFWQVCNIGRAGTFGHVNLNLNHLWTKKPNRLVLALNLAQLIWITEGALSFAVFHILQQKKRCRRADLEATTGRSGVMGRCWRPRRCAWASSSAS